MNVLLLKFAIYLLPPVEPLWLSVFSGNAFLAGEHLGRKQAREKFTHLHPGLPVTFQERASVIAAAISCAASLPGSWL